MDFFGIVTNLAPYVLAAVIAVAAAGALGWAGYRVYRGRGGRFQPTIAQWLAAVGLLGWAVVVAGVTVLSRGANYGDGVNLSLFSGYLTAWHRWSMAEFQLIWLNGLMFLPLGFFLPLLSRRLRLWKVLGLSVAATALLETVQLVTGRGIFELDDIFHNTLGSMAGYLLVRAVLDMAGARRFLPGRALAAAAIPLAFALLAGGAMLVYNAQPLGNVPLVPAVAQDMAKGSVAFTGRLPAVPPRAAIYKNEGVNDMDRAARLRDMVAGRFGLTVRGGWRVDGSSRVMELADAQGKPYYFAYTLIDGSWTLTDDMPAQGPVDRAALEAWGRDVDGWLKGAGFVPADCAFAVEEGMLRWVADPPQAVEAGNDGFFSGVAIAQPGEDMVIKDLFCTMARHDYVGQADILSPGAAFEQVERGNFTVMHNFSEGFELLVEAFALTYFYDTKGFYRPCYRFEGTLDGYPWSAQVAA